MNISETIRILSGQNLRATCLHCYEEFLLSESHIFDGTAPPPKEIASILRAQISEKKKELRIRTDDVDAQIARRANTSRAVKIGKGLETILFAHKNFNMNSYDFRFLANPIDLIIFNGLSKGRLGSITFADIKTGQSRLTSGEKSIKNAVDENRVEWMEI